MPFVEDKDQQVAFEKFIGSPEFEPEQKDFKELLLSAYRTENTIGSLISQEKGLPDSVAHNESFNPFDHMSDDEKIDESFVENAAMSDSMDELEAVRRQTSRERQDRRNLSEAGALGFVAGIGAATIDPINLIPVGGTAYKTYKGGASILHAGAATGSVAAGSAAATEAGLHFTQIERTYGESALNISGSFLLGGSLGAGASALSSRLNKSIPDIEEEINRSLSPEPVVAEGGDSVGAARVYEDAIVKGKVARGLSKLMAFDPLTRTVTSPEKATRTLVSEMAESPYAFEQGVGTAAETRIKIHDGKYVAAVERHMEAFKEYRKGGGTMKRREFNAAVSKAVRSGESPSAEIKKAADSWNDELYNPLKKEFIEAKLLPEDVEVETANNYLNRIWNKNKISQNLNGFIETTSKWLLSRGDDIGAEEADRIAEEIASRIMSTPDGRLPYDYQMGENIAKSSKGSGLSGSFKKRSFTIPDEMVEDFLENDIELLGARYLKATAPDLELVKMFGDVNMTDRIKKVEDGWIKKIRSAKSPKEADKLKKKRDSDISDISAMRDRIRGRYGYVDPDNPWVRAGRVIRDINYLRFMGGVTASSVPDAARVFMAEGFANTFKNGLGQLIRSTRGFNVAADEARRYGVGADMLMGGRSEIIADVADYSQGGTALERGTRSAAQSFGKINLMNPWTAGVKQLHAVTMQNTLIPDLMKGKIDKRLKNLGINDADAKNIGAQLKKYSTRIDGAYLANTKNWDSPELAIMWAGMMRKESDRVIVVPGQEKPLFMSNELGKTIFQFRSFMFSATQRVLISGLQGSDQNFIGGVLSLISMGSMAYAFKQWDAGREISDDPRIWLAEGIDRSGVLGIIMEANNTLEKTSSNSIGLRKLLGVATPASRFASRSQAEGLLGPTFGSFLTTTLRVANAGTDDKEWTDSDTRTLRRLLPYQNLMILRQGLDKLESEL